MRLVDMADGGKVYKDPKEWAKHLKKELEREYEIYCRQCRGDLDRTDLDEYLEGMYVSDFIEWFLENYFD